MKNDFKTSKEQEKEGYSIPAQVEYLKDYVYTDNLEIIEESTDSETAKQLGRTIFNEMLDYLK